MGKKLAFHKYIEDTDKVSLYMFLLAHKKIDIDLKSASLDDLKLSELENSTLNNYQYQSLMRKINNLKAML